MRILHIVRQFSPAIGGLENFVLCLARAQRAGGHDAHILTLDTVFHQTGPKLAAQETVEGIPVTRIGWSGSYKYPLALSARSHLAGFDLIHVHAVDFFADYLALLKPLHKTPMVLSTHGGFFHSTYASRLKRVFFNTVTRRTVRAYQRVIACSEGDETMFAPLCRPWLRLIENGVDVEKFADLGARQFSPSLLFIGRFSSNKRLDLLLETVAHLRTTRPDVRLTIIGRDWDDNLQRLRQRMTELALGDDVVRILLNLDDAAIQAEVGRHCFIASASDYEGFGMTLVEGMAAGLVPIASPIASFQTIVEQAGVGHLVDFHQPAQAAQSIAGYLAGLEPDYPAVRSQAITAAQRYGWVGTAERFMREYEAVLGLRARVIQGVAIDSRDGAAVVQALDEAVARRQPLQLAIANAHTVNLARNNVAYRQLLGRFLVLNDGAGVNIASQLKYRKPFAENLNGTDFVPRYLAESTHSLRVFLLGARPAVVALAHTRFSQQHPRHQWVGFEDGYGRPEDEAALCARIRQAAPDLLLVAKGNPLQEEWIARCAAQTGATVCVGVGALFDFTAGAVQRAPLWVRQLRCEWLYRLAQEPRRMWQRYLVGNVTFLWAARGDRV